MASLTRSKIAYDLSISPHRLQVNYGENDSICYVFSSELYLTKFIEKQEANRDQIERSLTKRFGVTARFPALADLRLYSSIEKRGFLLVRNEVEARCPEEITLDGEIVTFKSSEG